MGGKIIDKDKENPLLKREYLTLQIDLIDKKILSLQKELVDDRAKDTQKFLEIQKKKDSIQHTFQKKQILLYDSYITKL